MVPLHPLVPTPSNVRFRRALATLDATALRIIGERRAEARALNGNGNGTANGTPQRDPLGELIAAQDEAGKKLTDKELRDEVLTLVLAGHETTANNLTWTLMLLSQHPDVERRVFEEVSRVVGDGPVRLEHLPALEYTERVLSESLRLLPPAWMLERDALADDVVCGWQVPKGATVAVCAYLLHRHRRYWDNPEGFESRSLAAGALGSAAARRVPALRRRPAGVHRQVLRAHRGQGLPGGHGAPRAAGAGAGRAHRARAGRDPAAARGGMPMRVWRR